MFMVMMEENRSDERNERRGGGQKYMERLLIYLFINVISRLR